jgi:5-methylcytosine-specific restriction enzyme A
MPSAAPRICSCGSVVAFAVTCKCQRQRHHESKARFDARRPNSTARGYDHRWQQARREYLAEHPRCQHPECNAYATVMDHVISHKGDMRLFWDQKNWQGLCAHHHNSAKQRNEKRQ